LNTIGDSINVDKISFIKNKKEFGTLESRKCTNSKTRYYREVSYKFNSKRLLGI